MEANESKKNEWKKIERKNNSYEKGGDEMVRKPNEIVNSVQSKPIHSLENKQKMKANLWLYILRCQIKRKTFFP